MFSINRYYLDYNSTSPLAPSVMKGITRGDFSFANPMSLHSEGKSANKSLHLVEDFLFKTFNISSLDYQILFHSGATEGINLFFQGKSAYFKNPIFFSSKLDHPAVRELQNWFLERGGSCFDVPLTSSGIIDTEKLITFLSDPKLDVEQIVLNWTWVHNESGMISPISEIKKIKSIFPKITIHVDAVQGPGKIRDFLNLSPDVDAYTFSGHKFGSLKGVGFSFIKKYQKLKPLMMGGGQQNGQRPGTENILGVQSLKWALEDLINFLNFDQLQIFHADLYQMLQKLIEGKGEIMTPLTSQKNLNTIYFVLKNMPSDLSLALFDLNGLALSQGSACSSGSSKESQYLLHMNLKNYARHGLRLSHSPLISAVEVEAVKEKLKLIFEKIK